MSRHNSHATSSHLPGEPPEPVAIVGVGLRFPGGSNSLEEFEEFLRTGSSGIGPLPQDRWDVAAFTPQHPDDKGKIRARAGGYLERIDLFDAGFFNISPKEAQYIDPQQRMLLETAWQALEHANIDPTPLRRGNGGVYIGASSVDYALELDTLAYEELDGHLASGITLFPLAGRLSYFLGWRGPSISVDTACSSSLAALHMAVTALRRGECDIALGGAVNALHSPRIPVMFSNAQMLAADGQCKTFDESADGYARAEGCAVVVLKRLTDAQQDGDNVLAVIRGSAVGQDGDSAGLTVPNGPAQERVLRLALADAHLDAGDIGYVEAHGTGTPLGDPIEIGAISNVFADTHTQDDPLIVGSVKTNLGHMEPASGLVGVIKALLQIRSATIFPHLNFSTPSTRIPWEVYPVRIPTACEPWTAPVRRAAVNSFGFAGTIGALVLEQPPAPLPAAGGVPKTAARAGGAVFTLSAKSSAALRAQAEQYHAFLTSHPEADVAAVAYTANVGRAHFSHRIAAPVADRQALLALLDAARRPEAAVEPSGVRKVAFMFTGQGAQYAGMGAAPYRQFALFRQVVDECDRLFAPHLGRSVRALLLTTGQDAEQAIGQTLFTQAALFTLEYALARQWMSWGIKPNVLIGHSIGEVVAATVAGLFSLPDAVTLVAARARLMQSVRADGGMASVSAAAERIEPLLGDYPDLAVAAVNGPEACVISGASAPLAEVSARLAGEGIRVKALSVSHAFHSPLMAEVFDDFRTALQAVTFHEPSISLVSNLTGKVARMREIASAEYWVRHIGEPVRFYDGMRTVAKRGRHAFVEMGPSAMLCALGKSCVSAGDHVWLASLRRQDTGPSAMLSALAGFYAAGLGVDWAAYHAGTRPGMVQLPTYAFQRKPYWLPASTARSRPGASGEAHHPLLGRPRPAGQSEPQIREFESEFTLAELGELSGHRLGGQASLPPAAWAELLFALQDAVFGHTRHRIEDLRLPQPLYADDRDVVRLTTRLRRTGTHRAEVEVSGTLTRRTGGTGEGAEGGQGEVLTFVRARLAPDEQPPAAALHALAGTPGPPRAQAQAEDIATDLAAVGRGFGDAAPRLLALTRHPHGVVTGELAGGPAAALEQLPAALLESALTGAVALDVDGPVYALSAARSLRLFKKPRGQRLHLVARVRPEGAGRIADVLLLDDDEPVAEVLGAVLSRPNGAGGGPHFIHRADWLRRSLPEAAQTPGGRHVLLVGTAGAQTPAVLTALAGHARPDSGGPDNARPDSGGPDNGGPAQEVRLSLAADAQALDAHLADASVTDIAWFWQPAAGPMSYARLRGELEHNFRSLLRALAAPHLARARHTPRLWLVTERAQWLPGDSADGGEQLAAAALWGFGHVLLNEHPQLKATCVDVDGDGEAAAAALLAEWRAPQADEYQIAYRAGRRHVRRLLPGDAAPSFPGAFEVHAGAAHPPVLVPAEQPPPQDDQVRVQVTAAALTAQDIPAGPAGEGHGAPQPVTATACAGTVVAAGPAAHLAVGTPVRLTRPGVLGSAVTVPAAAVTPLRPGERPAAAAALAAGGTDQDAARGEVYRVEETDEALRMLPRRTGAVVIAFGAGPVPGAGTPEAGAGRQATGVRADRTYVVTGGLGGLGLVTAAKLVDLGARHLVLVSRSGRPTGEAAGILSELAHKATVSLLRADLGSDTQVAELVAQLQQLPHPVGGIVHAAGAIGSELISALDWPAIEEQLAPKVYGGWLLHEAAAGFAELDFFTVYSSIAAVAGARGGVGQAHYAAAFSFLDNLVHYRTRRQLPALSVNWGSWARVGASARLKASYITEIERSGVRLFSPSWALRALERLGQHGAAQRVVNIFDWDQFVARLPLANALFEHVAGRRQAAGDDAGMDLADLLARPRSERLKLIGRTVAERVAAVLHFGSADEVEPTADFVTLGLDSVMGMEVKSQLEADLGLNLPASLTFDHPSVRHITEFVDTQLSRQDG
ncbi:type I polyketide synthase [Streptomyces sp. S.PNR 29]|uniref:type I polyketide synthase n=1 Tax=Streptomyces sp. S.PNR 29 TaxID=2973805 RepID=UPI0025B1CF18|nr:type I polyketide synthase [Streptomyces sp. S.PNR 29]MDN0197936.1 SDR family NAD(P)-dependent oxidoreductase [Streptomyces sp. S.PNR 29]